MRAVLLDCRNSETALETLSAAVGVDTSRLQREIVSYSQRAIEEDPAADFPRDVLAHVGADIASVAFDGVWCFHGTRVFQPERLRSEGVLPLAKAIEQIWVDLQPLSGVGRRAWSAFRRRVETAAPGHYARLYREKIATSIHQGPHALVVREVHFEPPSGTTSYLRTPEIVEDIALSFLVDPIGGRDLRPAIATASTPCIVRWLRPDVVPSYLESAIWYLRRTHLGEPLCTQCSATVTEPGVVVPAEDIAEIEIDPRR